MSSSTYDNGLCLSEPDALFSFLFFLCGLCYHHYGSLICLGIARIAQVYVGLLPLSESTKMDQQQQDRLRYRLTHIGYMHLLFCVYSRGLWHLSMVVTS